MKYILIILKESKKIIHTYINIYTHHYFIISLQFIRLITFET